MSDKTSNLRSFRPKIQPNQTPPAQQDQQNPQNPQEQAQDGLTWKDLVTIPFQALTSTAPTRPEYLRRKYYDSLGLDPNRGMYQYRGWLNKLLRRKQF